ncbi:MAG: four helix bundle protein [Bacteroidales bacterium]|nr:four helix bundle protein [Bacteroidales bacterium]
MTVTDFEDLVIYKNSRALAKQIYDITNVSPFKNDYRFVQQIRAAAGSISDNIAEGFERQGNKEFKNFLYFAKGSCGELRSQLNRAYDVKFIDEETYQQMYKDCKRLSSSILRFIESLKSPDFVGTKYFDKPMNSNEHPSG